MSASRLIGRSSYLHSIQQQFDHCLRGHPRVVLVEGLASIGKTRFLEEAAAVAAHWDIEVYTGYCDEIVIRPYAPLSGLLPRLKAMQVLDEGDMALLQRFLSVSGLDDHTSSLDEVKQHQIQFRLALSRGIMALAQRQPMMLVMEDLHMADQPSLDVFVDMALAFATHQPVPLLLVGSYQPVVSEKDELTRALNKLLPEKMVHALQLAGLQEAETRELLQQLGVARPTQHLVQTLQD